MSAKIRQHTAVEYNSDEEVEGMSPRKRLRKDIDEGNDFKNKVQKVLHKLSDIVSCPFTVSGKVNAPMITISIKKLKNIVHFPLYEGEASQVVKCMKETVETGLGWGAGNLCELNFDEFEILNPDWNDFVNNELAAKIKGELMIDDPFTPMLNKMLLYKTGSFYQPYIVSESYDGNFATVIIQLPSLYKGGQLIVTHDERSVTSDFSSTVNRNEFSTFFTAFFWDCEHEVLQVTEGYRVCLVYNLITTQTAVPSAPRRQALEKQLADLMSNWEYRGKLVYALKHKYSEVSLDKLESTDRLIADFMDNFAKENDLAMYFTFINKENSRRYNGFCSECRRSYSDSGEVDADVDNGEVDADSSYFKYHSLSKLINTDGTIALNVALTVAFETEVIPQDCFKNIEAYRKYVKLTSSAATDITRFYRCAAIVFLPNRLLFEVLRKCGTSSADLENIFLKEVETYRGKVKDDKVKAKLKHWAIEIIMHLKRRNDNKTKNLIEAILELGDIQLIQALFTSCVTLSDESLPWVVAICEKYGWNNFAEQIPKMFEILSKERGIKLLGKICTATMDEEMKAVVHNSMEKIMGKCYSFYLMRNEQGRLAEQTFLERACRLAESMDFNMFQVLKSKPIQLIVPILLKLVPDNAKKLTPYWKGVAMHFVQKMVKEAARPAIILTWRRNDRSNCSCNECSFLNTFLASDQETITFEMAEDRRHHIEQRLYGMESISRGVDRRGHDGVLVIHKTAPIGLNLAEQRDFSLKYLVQFRAILPD